MSDQQRLSIDGVVEALRETAASDGSGALLLGAGCSVEAGIPTASGFVKVIQERFPAAYEAAEEKTYAECMAQLSHQEREDLVAEFLDNATMNWGHFAVAQLLKSGFVDRVLTTNFDPLLIRACALVDLFPSVYDFAAGENLNPPEHPGPCIFHLHGQRTGFVLLDKEARKKFKTLEPLIRDTNEGRCWVVLGYSGDGDPVFDRLADIPTFEHGLYWIGYQNAEPSEHVQALILESEEKNASYLKGFDADTFLVTLAQKLECFPPDFVQRPFSHLRQMVEAVNPYRIPGRTVQLDVIGSTRKLIDNAVRAYEEEVASETPAEKGSAAALSAYFFLMAGNYDEAAALAPESPSAVPRGFERASGLVLPDRRTRSSQRCGERPGRRSGPTR